MPVHHRIERAAQCLVLIVSGSLSNDEIDRAYAEAFASPDFVPGLDTLIDIRAAQTNPTPGDRLR